MKYLVRDECGTSEVIEADSIEDARDDAVEWVQGGDWGDDGAMVGVRIYDNDDDDNDELLDYIEVEVEPNHRAMIRECSSHGADNCCGYDPSDHDWTRDGCGGLVDVNPGVWSIGGTRMLYLSRCRNCGLHRSVSDPGEQKNHGEKTEYKYWYQE